MMTDHELKVVWAMGKYGGSFVKQLSKCFYLADQHNLKKLKKTFSTYWKRYEEVAKMMEAKEDKGE